MGVGSGEGGSPGGQQKAVVEVVEASACAPPLSPGNGSFQVFDVVREEAEDADADIKVSSCLPP